MKKTYSNKLVILSLVLPGILMFVFAILAPICLSIYYGFTDFSGMGSYSFIGLDNYIEMFQDEGFWLSLRNSLLLAAGFILIQHPLAIMTAALLDRMGKRQKDFSAVFIFCRM